MDWTNGIQWLLHVPACCYLALVVVVGWIVVVVMWLFGGKVRSTHTTPEGDRWVRELGMGLDWWNERESPPLKLCCW